MPRKSGALPLHTDESAQRAGELAAKCLGTSDQTSHFQIATKCVGKLDLARRLALDLEQSWAGDNHSHASSTRDCHVQAVQAVQKLHLGAEYGPLRSNSNRLAGGCLKLHARERTRRRRISKSGFSLGELGESGCGLRLPPSLHNFVRFHYKASNFRFRNFR